MKPARTSVTRTAVTSSNRRRRFQRLRWGSKNICLSGMDDLIHSTCAKAAKTVYAIQYESYGSRPRESIAGLAPDHCQNPRSFARGAAGCAGAGRRGAVAPVDAERAFSGRRRLADLRRYGQEPADAWAVCAHRWERRAARDADPAARVSAVSRR